MGIELTFAVIIAIVVGLVQVAKKTGLGSHWLPLLSLVFGVAGVSLLQGAFTTSGLLLGLVAGLSASGLWSGTKATFSTKEPS